VTAASGQHRHILALDTAGGRIAACIISDGECYFHQSGGESAGATRSTTIIPALQGLLEQACLSWRQLDVLALGAGPGSFTGLRVAAATLAGVNAALQLPLIQLSSLAITARQADSSEQIRVLEDARAGELFYGCYRQGEAVQADCCMRWSQVEKYRSESDHPGLFCALNEPPIALEGWRRVALSMPRSQALAIAALAACGKVKAWGRLPHYPSPNYLQPSQAERGAHHG